MDETKSQSKKRKLVRRKVESDSDDYVDDGGVDDHDDEVDDIVSGMLMTVSESFDFIIADHRD
jgi:hypothetical protein